ncbi:MAG: pentapeptide repeat-containing protein [Candidatus Omnitrophica bacterium]|nr:pentapeptide repeat-containing protein [Candidatus Omnitrophota bacterium]
MNKCTHKDCKEIALSLSSYCWDHVDDREAYRKTLSEHIDSSGSIKGLYLRRLEFQSAQWQNIDAEEVDLAGADLSRADLTAANLKRANLTGANLHRANLASIDFEDTHLLRCDLSGARLWSACINNSNLAEANLQEADFLKASITGVKFWHVKLEKAKFLTKFSFTGKAPIDESGPLSASEAYRSLKQYFMVLGRYDDASWASFKEKQLERKDLFHRRRIAYIPSLLMAFLCGYGEKPYRVIASSVTIIFLYSFVYTALNILKVPLDYGSSTLRFWDYIYFSIVTFTTLGFGDLTPKLAPLFQMLTGSEAFVGAFMMGLFVFTLARKYAAR